MQFVGLFRNLRAGWLLVSFRREAFNRFQCNYDQAVLLVIVDLIFTIVADYVEKLPGPTFNVYAFETQVVGFGCVLLVGYIIAKSLRDDGAVIRFLVPLYSVSPLFYLLWIIIGLVGNYPGIEVYWTYFAYSVYTVWGLTVIGFILVHLCGGRKLLALGHLLIYLFVVALVGSVLNREFWYETGHHTSASGEDTKQVNVESVYYSQAALIGDATAKLRPGRIGVPDMYFVGFAGYAAQDVFMKEVRYAKALFDKRFDTLGRSILLVNNRDTVNDTPIASLSNLRMVLNHIGQTMNREDDVLFLFMTSHGSATHELSTRFWPLQLNTISAVDLKAALDEAGIKWRVLAISACYSGGSIESLKDDHTMIMTAAAPDKQSFGCGNENDFTYFGEVMFDEQLTQELSFKTAFTKAAESLRERELKENLEPSEPQMYMGKEIDDRLKTLERRWRELTDSNPL